jgi:hypothetical protein
MEQDVLVVACDLSRTARHELADLEYLQKPCISMILPHYMPYLRPLSLLPARTSCGLRVVIVKECVCVPQKRGQLRDPRDGGFGA